jgi:hypothetical protein
MESLFHLKYYFRIIYTSFCYILVRLDEGLDIIKHNF